MKVAAVDIGTNTTRLLIADHRHEDLFDGSRLEWLDRRVTVTRLGQGVDQTGVLADAAMGRTVAVLAGYGEALRSWGVDSVRAVATSATRDAANSETFLDRAELALGVRPDVISGADEAELSFRGARSGVATDRPALVIDVGGGSTEFVQGKEQMVYAVSVDIGSVRLTERELPNAPPAEWQLAAARERADEVFESIELPGPPSAVIGVAGTFTSVAAIILGLATYDPERVHGTELTTEALASTTNRLAGMSLAELEDIPSLDPARAPVVLGGAVVAERALAITGVGTVTVSEADILDGVALSLVDGG